MKHYVWAFIWTTFVLIMMSAPLSTSGVPAFSGMDKLVHTGFFFVLTVLLFFGHLKNSTRPRFISISTFTIFILPSTFAFLTEIIQKVFFSYRSFEWWDIFADHVGIGMGLFAYFIFIRALDITLDR